MCSFSIIYCLNHLSFITVNLFVDLSIIKLFPLNLFSNLIHIMNFLAYFLINNLLYMYLVYQQIYQLEQIAVVDDYNWNYYFTLVNICSLLISVTFISDHLLSSNLFINLISICKTIDVISKMICLLNLFFGSILNLFILFSYRVITKKLLW